MGWTAQVVVRFAWVHVEHYLLQVWRDTPRSIKSLEHLFKPLCQSCWIHISEPALTELLASLKGEERVRCGNKATRRTNEPCLRRGFFVVNEAASFIAP